MLHEVTTGAYYPPVFITWKSFTTGASYLTTRTLCSRVNSTIHGVCHHLSNYPGRPLMQWVNSQIDQHGNRIFPKISRTCQMNLSYEISQLVWCFKIYWRYSFNGYWRMDFPDWGFHRGGDFVKTLIKQFSSHRHFPPSDKVCFPPWWWWLCCNWDEGVTAGLMIWSIIPRREVCFCCFNQGSQLKPTVLTIFVLLNEVFAWWWKKSFFLLFHWTQRTGVSPFCREVCFLAVISENAAFRIFRERKCLKSLKLKMIGGGADSLNQLTSP